ncbi:SUMF1/EgtB/PvdO family nonheme iron enzyme [Marinicaulis aureus]|uniref:SUMF1/EgtB/PvdO family nonheme iron enzyme n=1 Tax=Hyphococcus aureus TaxID=2666033 RepID=A0ABW1KUV2_9PROT
MTHIFISYNREDQFRARMIADALQAEGLDVWWDSNLRAGESYDEVTEKHLREAGAVVVLWSQRSVNSKWVRAEATVGERFSKLVPAMIDHCERPLRFELVQTADLVNWQGDRSDPNWRLFMQGVKNAVGHHDVAPPAAAPSASGSPGASSDNKNDVTIENTFWTSIKDGTERADFEAYLKRYPEGHFADLARNRLAALQRAAQPKPSAPAAPAPQPTPRPIQRAAPAPAQPARKPAAAKAAAPQPAPKQKSGGGAMIAIVAIAALVIGGGVFGAMQFMKSDASAETKIAAVTPAQEEPVIQDAPAEEDVVEDVSVDTTDMLDNSDEEVALAGTEDALQDAGEDIAVLTEETDAAPDTEVAVVEETALAEPGQPSSFSDCENCPVMATLPGGAFMMGSPAGEPGRAGYEGPLHEVTVAPFAMSETEVTHEQWQACVDDGGCGAYTPGDAGFGREGRPAIFISWRDANAYAKWLSAKTGKAYRLPTEAEWEYAARGGTSTAYWWGDRFDRSHVAMGATRPGAELAPNPFGLRGMLGNAAEWVEDCYVNNYAEAPVDGSAVKTGDCGRRVVRGGSWRDQQPAALRSANRSRITQTVRDRAVGFRVALSLG